MSRAEEDVGFDYILKINCGAVRATTTDAALLVRLMNSKLPSPVSSIVIDHNGKAAAGTVLQVELQTGQWGEEPAIELQYSNDDARAAWWLDSAELIHLKSQKVSFYQIRTWLDSGSSPSVLYPLESKDSLSSEARSRLDSTGGAWEPATPPLVAARSATMEPRREHDEDMEGEDLRASATLPYKPAQETGERKTLPLLKKDPVAAAFETAFTGFGKNFVTSFITFGRQVSKAHERSLAVARESTLTISDSFKTLGTAITNVVEPEAALRANPAFGSSKLLEGEHELKDMNDAKEGSGVAPEAVEEGKATEVIVEDVGVVTPAVAEVPETEVVVKEDGVAPAVVASDVMEESISAAVPAEEAQSPEVGYIPVGVIEDVDEEEEEYEEVAKAPMEEVQTAEAKVVAVTAVETEVVTNAVVTPEAAVVGSGVAAKAAVPVEKTAVETMVVAEAVVTPEAAVVGATLTGEKTTEAVVIDGVTEVKTERVAMEEVATITESNQVVEGVAVTVVEPTAAVEAVPAVTVVATESVAPAKEVMFFAGISGPVSPPAVKPAAPEVVTVAVVEAAEKPAEIAEATEKVVIMESTAVTTPVAEVERVTVTETIVTPEGNVQVVEVVEKVEVLSEAEAGAAGMEITLQEIQVPAALTGTAVEAEKTGEAEAGFVTPGETPKGGSPSDTPEVSPATATVIATVVASNEITADPAATKAAQEGEAAGAAAAVTDKKPSPKKKSAFCGCFSA